MRNQPQLPDSAMKREVRTHFNKISGFYEKKKREFYLRMLKESIGQYEGGKILDFGCGTGLALSWLSGERVGVDFSQQLLRNAHEGPDYVVADVETTPFRNASFDLAICFDVLEHLPTLRVIDEAYRILSDDGVFHLSTADKHYCLILEILEKLKLKLPEGPHNWRSRNEILERMVQAGFTCQEWSHPPLRFYKGSKKSSK